MIDSARGLGAALALSALCFGAPTTQLEAQAWWETATGVSAGRFPVGFEVRVLIDSSRPLASGAPRRSPISLWYPTPRPHGHPAMTYGDYVAALPTDSEGISGVAENKRIQDQLQASV